MQSREAIGLRTRAGMPSRVRRPGTTAVLLAALIATSAGANAAAPEYPDRPVRLVVVYPPGGGIDILARAMGQKLTETWGAPIVVDNRPGAGTTLASAIVAKAPADGYTLLMTDVSFAISSTLYRQLPYDAGRSFAPVSLLNLVTDVLVVHPTLPANNVKELVAHARGNPGKVLYASAGNGTLNHLAPEMLKAMTGIDLVHVPYKGAIVALGDVLAGQTQVYVGALVSALPHIRSGRLRALAITGKNRSNVLPDLPTVAEQGFPGFDVSAWYGLLAPAGTPRPVIEKLHREVARIVHLPDIQQRLVADGAEPVGSSPAAFADFLRSEIAKWGAAVKSAGAKVD